MFSIINLVEQEVNYPRDKNPVLGWGHQVNNMNH